MEIDRGPNEPTKVDTTASQACTRSGTFVLVLSGVLFVLVTSWAHRPSEVALAQYITYRINLDVTIERLDKDPVWLKFKDSNGVTASTPIGQIPIQLTEPVSSVPATTAKKPPKRGAKSRVPFSPGTQPSVPTGFAETAQIDIPEIPALRETMKSLNDSDLLTRSREYSNFFEVSIVHWAQRREDLIYRNQVESHCTTKNIQLPHNDDVPSRFVAAIDPDVLVACLNLNDVRELVQLERPLMTNPDQIGAHVGREIEILPGTMPRDPYLASLISNAFLFFALIYFGAFAREAILSETFPVHGTIFGAFYRSRWTLFVALVALWAPFFASLAVAIASRHPLLWTEAIVILFAVISIVVILQRKSYWTPLNPRNWNISKRQGKADQLKDGEKEPTSTTMAD